MMWMNKAILVLVLGLGVVANAETPVAGDHNGGAPVAGGPKTIAPVAPQVPVEDKGQRLINAINACLAGRPAGASGSSDSALIQSTLSRILR
jgi:hypothetical protein